MKYKYAFNKERPKEGLVLKAVANRVIDGDTLEAIVSFKIKVRLLGVNAPEKKESGWTKFKNRLKSLVFKKPLESQEITIFIPNQKPLTLLDVTTFDRFLGEVWVDDININEVMEKEIQEFSANA